MVFSCGGRRVRRVWNRSDGDTTPQGNVPRLYYLIVDAKLAAGMSAFAMLVDVGCCWLMSWFDRRM